ncbi:MAG: tol-pal system protein YbgF [Endozoicomonas sp.]
MITGKKDLALRIRQRLTKQVLVFSIITISASGVAAALAPIKDSVPISTSTSQAGVNRPSDLPVSSISSDQTNNSTAHLINTLNQMQQELMEVRGQLEEQTYLINKLQQENRDRYVDLDDRIIRLSNTGSASKGSDLVTDIKPTAPLLIKPVQKTASKVSSKEEENSYQAAFSMIRSKQFDNAKSALQKQLETYPKGRYAANSHYWLGEVEMAQGSYDDALRSFFVVIKDFPKSTKVPDASYKLGRIYDMKGERNKSKALLEAVIEKYPGSAAARLSDTYLRAMGS